MDIRELIDRDDLYGKGAKFSFYLRKPFSTYFGPQSENIKIRFKRGMYGRNGQLEQIGLLIVRGRGNREIVRLTGAHIVTVAKLRRVLMVEFHKDFKCQCLKPATHNGWCHYRFKKSSRRQQFMTKWHSNEAEGV